MILKIILIFIAGFVVDLLITKYTSDVARGESTGRRCSQD